MAQLAPDANLIELDAMQVLAHSGTFPGATIASHGSSWYIYLQASPKAPAYFLRAQRNNNQPRFFQSVESALRVIKKLGMTQALIIMDKYVPEQESML